jgi:peptidoglycan/LPS O-acetylase OafA/YrhL
VLFALGSRFVHGFRALSNIVSYNMFGYSLICCVATGLIAFSLGTQRGWWMAFTTARPVRWIGMVSYSGYLIHPFCIGLVTPFGSRAKDVPLALVVALAYASLSWVLIEKPIMKLRPARWIRERRGAAVQLS